jgi:hypothetical protein
MPDKKSGDEAHDDHEKREAEKPRSHSNRNFASVLK